MALTEQQAKRLAAGRGQELSTLVEAAASAAHEAVRMIRRGVRGDGGDRWEAAPYARRRRWEERALAVGLGHVVTVRELYARVLDLREEEDIARAWDGVLGWRLLELAVELATMKLVMGSVLSDGRLDRWRDHDPSCPVCAGGGVPGEPVV